MAILAPTKYTPRDLTRPAPQPPSNYGGGWSDMQGPPQPAPGLEWDPYSPGKTRRSLPVGSEAYEARNTIEQNRLRQQEYERLLQQQEYERLRKERLDQQQYMLFEQQYSRNQANAGRAEQAFNTQRSATQGLQSVMHGLQTAGGYGQTSVPTGTTPAVGFPQVSMGAIPDASAAQSAAFGAAKAKAGSMGRAAVDSLRSNLAERSILGGGTEARGLIDILAAATNPLSDLNVAQQGERLTDVRRAQELGAQQAAQQYAGGITQRGQDIQDRQVQAQLAQQRQLEQMHMLQQALAGLSTSY